MTVTITIPGLPPTANDRHYIGDDDHLHTRSTVKRWHGTVAAYGRHAMQRRPLFTVPVRVRIVFRVSRKRRRDIDAGIKDTLDGMSGRAATKRKPAQVGTVLANDRLVRHLEVELVEVASAKDEATVVTVEDVADIGVG